MYGGSGISIKLFFILRGRDLEVHSVAISPDRNCITSGSGSFLTNETKTILIWVTKSGEVLFGPVAGHSNVPYAIHPMKGGFYLDLMTIPFVYQTL